MSRVTLGCANNRYGLCLQIKNKKENKQNSLSDQPAAMRTKAHSSSNGWLSVVE
jgi:hypothetical protein